MKDYIQLGIEKGLISFNEDMSRITYVFQKKERNYNNPEEKVQAETFVKLVCELDYKVERIRNYVPVTMGSDKKEADIVVYDDDLLLTPLIIVECKKQEISNAEFEQAIEQAYSYAYALPGDVKYIWVTSGIRNEYYEVDKQRNTRQQLQGIPRFGHKISKRKPYRYAYKAEKVIENEGCDLLRDIETIEQSELTRRFKLAHQSLWNGGELEPSDAFDELDKLIFCKIWDERKDRRVGEPYDFQIYFISKDEIEDDDERRKKENEDLYSRILALYEEGRKKDKEVFRDNIQLTPEKLRAVVGYIEGVNLNKTDLDAKGRAFETFIGSFFRGDFGQYFTPRPIVDFIVDALPINNQSKVLDTSCGSGGFLLYVLNKIRNQATSYFPDYHTDPEERMRWYAHWHSFAENNLFGIELSKKISRTAKMNMIIHDDGHTNVVRNDGLESPEQIEQNTGNDGFQYGTFDFIITNPPFGSTVRQTEQAYLKTYQLGKKEEDWLAVKAMPENIRDGQDTQVLFIEQDYNFLKEGGYLAIVIPDGILTNSSMQYVRNQIEDWFRIIAVVSLPQIAFSANKANVKSSVLFLRKWSKGQTNKLVKTKRDIEARLLKDSNYIMQRQTWEAEIKQKQRDRVDLIKKQKGITVTEAKQTYEYKSWNADMQTEYAGKVDELKFRLLENYQQAKQSELPDYPIFMAIAEEIGYDATGNKTGNNELEVIGEELKKFIATL